MDKMNCQAWALTIIRLALGVIFFMHGAQKVLGWFGGSGLEGFVKWASGYKIPVMVGYIAAFAEFIGGILLFTGILPRLGGLMVMGVMLGATFIIHWPNGFFVQNNGYEYTLFLSLCSLAIIICGPGKSIFPKMS